MKRKSHPQGTPVPGTHINLDDWDLPAVKIDVEVANATFVKAIAEVLEVAFDPKSDNPVEVYLNFPWLTDYEGDNKDDVEFTTLRLSLAFAEPHHYQIDFDLDEVLAHDAEWGREDRLPHIAARLRELADKLDAYPATGQWPARNPVGHLPKRRKKPTTKTSGE